MLSRARRFRLMGAPDRPTPARHLPSLTARRSACNTSVVRTYRRNCVAVASIGSKCPARALAAHPRIGGWREGLSTIRAFPCRWVTTLRSISPPPPPSGPGPAHSIVKPKWCESRRNLAVHPPELFTAATAARRLLTAHQLASTKAGAIASPPRAAGRALARWWKRCVPLQHPGRTCRQSRCRPTRRRHPRPPAENTRPCHQRLHACPPLHPRASRRPSPETLRVAYDWLAHRRKASNSIATPLFARCASEALRSLTEAAQAYHLLGHAVGLLIMSR